jgi:hypothetical protein
MALPCPSRAFMPRPALSIFTIGARVESAFALYTIQTTAGIRFEIDHDSLGQNICLNYDVHVIRTHMRCQQSPTSLRTDLLY